MQQVQEAMEEEEAGGPTLVGKLEVLDCFLLCFCLACY